MSEMHYRFKSPDEMRAEQNQDQSGQKRRNKISLMVLLDIAILAVVMAVVYFGGVLDEPALVDPEPIKRENHSLNASHKIGDGSCIFYLHVENTSASEFQFPGQSDQPLRASLVDNNGASLYANMQAEQEGLGAGQTRILRAEIPCPKDRLPLQSARISLGEKPQQTSLDYSVPGS